MKRLKNKAYIKLSCPKLKITLENVYRVTIIINNVIDNL